MRTVHSLPKAAVVVLLVATVSLIAAGLLAQETPSSRPAASQDDLNAIRATALDYVDGWYTGDGDRMARALHPELAKRIAMTRKGEEKSQLRSMTAEQLVQAARSGGGTKTPADQQQRDIEILDVFGGAASVRATMHDWIDYMHIARVDGEWVIVNVLWEFKPEVKSKRGLQ